MNFVVTRNPLYPNWTGIEEDFAPVKAAFNVSNSAVSFVMVQAGFGSPAKMSRTTSISVNIGTNEYRGNKSLVALSSFLQWRLHGCFLVHDLLMQKGSTL